MYAPPRSTVLSPAMSSLTRCVTVKECGCVCLRARDRWMPRGSGLDLLIKAKHLLSPPHLQCHKLPTQAAKPCLLSADTVPLLFQCIKHQSRKCYFSYKAKPSQVAASQGSTRSATAFLCQMWLRILTENPKPLSPFTVFTSLHFSSFNCSCSPNQRYPTAVTADRSPQCISTSMGSQPRSGGFTNKPLFSQQPNVSF